MNWYVLYTTAKAEKQVEIRLKARDIETYLPLHLCPRKWSDRVKMVEMPLFPSYIFVKTTDEQLRTLYQINGVARIVYYNGSPAIVRQKEIDAMRTFVEKAREKSCTFLSDDEVKVVCGPLKNVQGKVIKAGKDKLILFVEQIGVTVCVQLNQVVKK